MTKTNKPHVHAEVIKAWADGKPVEWRICPPEDWQLIENPGFVKDYEYRIKPEEVVDYTIVLADARPGAIFTSTISDLSDYYHTENVQGYMKRTRLHRKVVSFEFIPK